LRELGVLNPRDAVRVGLAEAARDLPSYQRLSGFALTDQPLPRTGLGKFRRFLLPRLYLEARSGRAARPAGVLGEADAALLTDPTARAVWALLQQRYPAGPIGLDVNLALDLNLDSFGWMELTIALQERLGVSLSGADIIDIATIRDLLRRCIELRASTTAAVAQPAPAIAEDIDRWLAPTGFLLTTFGALLYALNWAVMRGMFRLRVIGREHLPEQGCFVITPNHVSDMDPLAMAASLSLARLRRTYWAADIVRLSFDNALARLFCRAVHLFPADATHPGAAIRAAIRVLDAGHAQIWFPEGWRSPDGQLQRFMPGIGQLLLRTGALVVPTWIDGTFEALPRFRHMPRLHQLSVTFGPPVDPATLRAEGIGSSDEERIAQALHDRVNRLAPAQARLFADRDA
jgi:long-chain acyl-CoA synthetase